MLTRLTVDSNGKPLYSYEEGTGGFSDVSPGDWYSSYVHFAQKYGIVQGYAGGSHPFPDVPAGYWAAREIAFAASQGWISGGSDGTFQPGRNVTRAEAVKILNRAVDRQAAERETVFPFTDVARDHWAYHEILEASVTHDYEKNSQGEVWL